MAEELRSQMEEIKNQLSNSMEAKEKLEKLVTEKEDAIRNSQNDMSTELDSVKSKIQTLQEDNEKLIQNKKSMAMELVEIKEQLHDAIKVAEDSNLDLQQYKEMTKLKNFKKPFPAMLKQSIN